MRSCFSIKSLFARQARVFALSWSAALRATTMSHGSVAAAELTRSSCAKFFHKSKDKIPVLYCTVLSLSSSFNAEQVCWDVMLWWWSRSWLVRGYWLRLRSVLPYWLIPLLSAGVSAGVVASLTWVCQKCHRLVQPFLITVSFWQMRVREWRLDWCSSRWEGGREAVPAAVGRGAGLGCWGQKPAPPVQLGLEERFGPRLCSSREHVFWRLRVAFMPALRYRCWRGFTIHRVNGNGQFQICCCPRSFYMQGLCTGNKIDAWSSAPDVQHLQICEQWRSLVEQGGERIQKGTLNSLLKKACF